MKHRTIFVIILLALVLFSGCASILEGETLSVSPRPASTPGRLPGDEQIEASNFDELKSAILGFIAQHSESGQILVYSYDGELEPDIDRAIYDIRNHDPLGAFAVVELSGEVRRIVSYFEVDITIEFSRTQREIESIIAIYNIGELRNVLFDLMREYSETAIFRTALPEVTAESVTAMVGEIYYGNPRDIVIMPAAAAHAFPAAHGDDKIIELLLDNMGHPAGILLLRTDELAEHVRRNVETAHGNTEIEILMSLANNMLAFIDFDAGTAQGLAAHGTQNPAVTAHNALVYGSAVGEGFAMAFKAVCDELGITSEVILGRLNDMIHAWNIVLIDGEYYHIDVSMGMVNGIETVFLRTGDEFIAMGYYW